MVDSESCTLQLKCCVFQTRVVSIKTKTLSPFLYQYGVIKHSSPILADEDSFDGNVIRNSSSFESRFWGSVLSRREVGNSDSVPEGSKRRSLFGSIVKLFSRGPEADVSDRLNQMEAGEVGTEDKTNEERIKFPHVNKAGLLPDFQEEAPQETHAEEGEVPLKWGAEGRPTDPLAEETKDPLVKVLTEEDNQELEQIQGALRYEIFQAEKDAAERSAEGVSVGEDPPSGVDVTDPQRRRALLQQKIDEQLAPYKKGGFTYADVATQRNKTGMSVHFTIRNGTITMVKDPEELSDNWSYWYR